MLRDRGSSRRYAAWPDINYPFAIFTTSRKSRYHRSLRFVPSFRFVPPCPSFGPEEREENEKSRGIRSIRGVRWSDQNGDSIREIGAGAALLARESALQLDAPWLLWYAETIGKEANNPCLMRCTAGKMAAAADLSNIQEIQPVHVHPYPPAYQFLLLLLIKWFANSVTRLLRTPSCRASKRYKRPRETVTKEKRRERRETEGNG